MLICFELELIRNRFSALMATENKLRNLILYSSPSIDSDDGSASTTNSVGPEDRTKAVNHNLKSRYYSFEIFFSFHRNETSLRKRQLKNAREVGRPEKAMTGEEQGWRWRWTEIEIR